MSNMLIIIVTVFTFIIGAVSHEKDIIRCLENKPIEQCVQSSVFWTTDNIKLYK